MKLVKEVSFRLFIIFVMLSLSFVAMDMSKPVILSQSNITANDVVECIVQPYSGLLEGSNSEATTPAQGFHFIYNILLPLIFYIISIGGFLYLLIDDFRMLNTFSKQNKLAKVLWTIWMIVLIGLLLVPVFFGLELLMKGFVLAVIATAIFLILIGLLYRLSYNTKK